MTSSKKDRDLCCCCIRLRLAVAVVSLIYLAITAATTYQKYVANDLGDRTAKIIIFVSAGFQALIALLGLLSALTKVVVITRVYCILWWILTLAVLAMSVGNLFLIIRNDKDAVRDQCRRTSTPSEGANEVTDEQADGCFKLVVIISSVVLGLQFVLMCLIGWVNQRFLREVRQDVAVDNALKAVDESEA
ncbi:hypothetical protein BGW38_006284 [Lunasporangiospora selenospora]|uniref:Uncharacterized protein n=1 Tax=Lunasporangiospora selenospora TaxID=979761 RepID=A0A9P6G2L4_9FUNG|nr:hypothetical protein BGW38_006284 [Lunasporangiospora selenospora]